MMESEEVDLKARANALLMKPFKAWAWKDSGENQEQTNKRRRKKEKIDVESEDQPWLLTPCSSADGVTFSAAKSKLVLKGLELAYVRRESPGSPRYVLKSAQQESLVITRFECADEASRFCKLTSFELEIPSEKTPDASSNSLEKPLHEEPKREKLDLLRETTSNSSSHLTKVMDADGENELEDEVEGTRVRQRKKGKRSSRKELNKMDMKLTLQDLARLTEVKITGVYSEEFTKHFASIRKSKGTVVPASCRIVQKVCAFAEHCDRRTKDDILRLLKDKAMWAEIYIMELASMVDREGSTLEEFYAKEHHRKSKLNKSQQKDTMTQDVAKGVENTNTKVSHLGRQWKDTMIKIMWGRIQYHTPARHQERLGDLQSDFEKAASDMDIRATLVPKLYLDKAIAITQGFFTSDNVPFFPVSMTDTTQTMLRTLGTADLSTLSPSVLLWALVNEESYKTIPLLKLDKFSDAVNVPISRYHGYRNAESLEEWRALLLHIILSTIVETDVFDKTDRALAARCMIGMEKLESEDGIAMKDIIDLVFLSKLGPEVIVFSNFAMAAFGERPGTSPVCSIQHVIAHFYRCVRYNRGELRKDQVGLEKKLSIYHMRTYTSGEKRSAKGLLCCIEQAAIVAMKDV